MLQLIMVSLIQVQTELVLLTQKRNDLLQAEAEEEQNQTKLKHMQEEKESLRLIRDLLRQQRENNEVPGQARESNDGWVIVPGHDRPHQS